MESGKTPLLQRINSAVFFPPAILLVIAVLVGIAYPEKLGTWANQALAFSLANFSWFYNGGTALLLIFCAWAAFGKPGRIIIGGPEAKPVVSTFNWFVLAWTSGIAIGAMFYCVAEPMSFFTDPPTYLGQPGGTAEAGEQALRYTFFHWAFHPYAFYTSAGVCIAFMHYNAKRNFRVSSALYPLLGDKIDGLAGHLVNALAAFTMVACLGTSLGLGTMQLAGGINYVFGTSYASVWLWVLIIAVVCVFYIAAACSGLHKGMKYLGQLKVYLYVGLCLFVLVTGGTILILNNTLTGIGAYFDGFIMDTLYLEPFKRSGWVGGWTVFYWAWWLTAAPIVGLFLVKMAQGRTIRQFILMNMLAPSLFTFFWFGVFGSAAINMELISGIKISEEISSQGVQIALFALLKNLPFGSITMLVGLVMIVISFVTMADAMTLALADMTSANYGQTGSPVVLKIFWGGMMGLIALALLLSGGLQALQTSVVVCGVPILLVQLAMAGAFIKAMVGPKRYDLVNAPEGGQDPTNQQQAAAMTVAGEAAQ